MLARREASSAIAGVCPVGSTVDRYGSGATTWRNGWLSVRRQPGQRLRCNCRWQPGARYASTGVEATLTLTGPAGVARFNPNGTQGAAGAGNLTFTTRGDWTGSKSYVETVTATGNVSMAAGS